jgi:hypothetical protein
LQPYVMKILAFDRIELQVWVGGKFPYDGEPGRKV